MWDTVVAERQASAGARDGVKGKGRTLAARAPLHALVRRLWREPWPDLTQTHKVDDTVRESHTRGPEPEERTLLRWHHEKDKTYRTPKQIDGCDEAERRSQTRQWT